MRITRIEKAEGSILVYFFGFVLVRGRGSLRMRDNMVVGDVFMSLSKFLSSLGMRRIMQLYDHSELNSETNILIKVIRYESKK